VSPQDFSPAPYPLYAENGARDPYVPLIRRTRERYWLYSLLFALTIVTTCAVGASMQIDFERNMPFDIERSLDLWGAIWTHPLLLLRGIPFSFTLLGILLSHEFGHYLAAEFHQVDASLPYFLPSPFLGTFGAFIRVRSPIYSKRALFDIGIAGPLAGFVCLVPALAVGLAFSKIVPGAAHQSDIHFGSPGLEWLLIHAVFPGTPVSDICLHPIARAAWIGMFATAMNLLPIGQLDGGHILYSFFPRRHRIVSRILCLVMLPCGILWKGWAFWGLVLFWLGRRHPVIEDPEPLDLGRRKLGLIALVVFALCLTLVPFSDGGF
jgi:membrane-associated protease RseP (regulator of RpoE activity)